MAVASSSSSSSSDACVTEEQIILDDGRVLEFVCGGDRNSSKIMIAIHGVFGVGALEQHISKFWYDLGWKCLCPTLPGWGKSSNFPKGKSVAEYSRDVQQLITKTALTPPTCVLVFGGSYGSIWAMACAANAPSYIKGLFILGGFSPFKEHYNYTEGMTWANWLTVGKPGQWWPLSLLHPMVGRLISWKAAGNVDGSLALLRSMLTGPGAMTEEEHQQIANWAITRGTSFAEWELGMARNMAASIQYSLDGYYDTPRIINSDWGFKLEDIHLAAPGKVDAMCVSAEKDIPHILAPVVIAGAVRDHLAPISMQRYVASRIPGAQMVELQGNHISGITLILPIFTAMVAGLALQAQI